MQTLHRKLSIFITLFIIMMACMGSTVYGSNDPGTGQDISPQAKADFILSSYSYETSCDGEYVIIRWESDKEENLENYRLHRRTLTGYEDGVPQYSDSKWLGSTYIQASSSRRYNTMDTTITIGVDYNYRLYGYDSSRQLSNAKVINLNNITTFSCWYLPIFHR